MKKKRFVPEERGGMIEDPKRRRKKTKLVDAKFFVLPYVVMKQQIRRAPIGPFGLEDDVQKRLEEAALLARWRRKHRQVT